MGLVDRCDETGIVPLRSFFDNLTCSPPFFAPQAFQDGVFIDR
jgi:hypothetical protein